MSDIETNSSIQQQTSPVPKSQPKTTRKRKTPSKSKTETQQPKTTKTRKSAPKAKKPRAEGETSEEYDNFKVGFGKKNDVVETPDELYQILDNEFHFDHDPAPVWPDGIIVTDGLTSEWGQSNFINPPYSNIGKWFEKAVKESVKGKTSVFLVPFRLTPIYWRKWVYPYASEIRVIANRIQFKNYPSTAPFPVGIIVYRPSVDGKAIRPSVDFEHKKYPMKKLL